MERCSLELSDVRFGWLRGSLHGRDGSPLSAGLLASGHARGVVPCRRRRVRGRSESGDLGSGAGLSDWSLDPQAKEVTLVIQGCKGLYGPYPGWSPSFEQTYVLSRGAWARAVLTAMDQLAVAQPADDFAAPTGWASLPRAGLEHLRWLIRPISDRRLASGGRLR